MAEDQWIIRNCRNQKMSKEEEFQSKESEKRILRRARRSSIDKDRPNFPHDSDGPADVSDEVRH
ncbi:hypothetical protein ABG768_014790 [Culter alburnus]|uniref:IBB domain-containing protein n=1 Tax=Culter alburnus TaxID=194366 RepID=A0AAW1Z1Q9_CULAL